MILVGSSIAPNVYIRQFDGIVIAADVELTGATEVGSN